jgi:hypothetical protein
MIKTEINKPSLKSKKIKVKSIGVNGSNKKEKNFLNAEQFI